ncbi:DnaD domain protein [Streptococcus hyointestinalis]|uniref:DnaD domain protein n=1 Tax=Streptococcus hyointestinalis TaxID=1337 RepID=UPI0013DF7E70|nr:DnaD domain protein [Streptococcus hyointestinalis]
MLILTKEIKQAMKFYKMPRALFESKEYQGLSVGARSMYMLLFDRLDLSVKNGWTDEQGYTYQYYTIDQFMLDLNCSNKTVVKLKKELSDYQLLNEVTQGANKPNRLYLGVPKDQQGVNNLHNGRVESTQQGVNNLHNGRVESTQQGVNNLHGIKTNISRLINKTDISRTTNQEGAAEVADKNPIFEKLKEAFGEMSVGGRVVEEVEDLLETHGQALVLFALDETILNAGKSIRYTRAILNNWQSRGLRTVEQVKQNKADYQRQQQPNQQEADNEPFDPFPDVPF